MPTCYRSCLPLLISLLIVATHQSLLTKRAESQYNMTESKHFNSYSAVTFCSDSQILSWNCTVCKKVQKAVDITVIDNNRTNVRGYVGYLPQSRKIIIAFRGTKDIKNWLQDFSFELVQYHRCDKCMIHVGWYGSFFSVESHIWTAVKTLSNRYSNPKIHITGGSLGGALAMVTAIQLQFEFGTVEEVHVFGCPRVGNAQFANFYNKKIPAVFRVVHNRDIVPHVPFVSQNYHHPFYEVLFDENMEKFKICDNSGEDSSCSDQFYPEFSIPDHMTYWDQPALHDVCN